MASNMSGPTPQGPSRNERSWEARPWMSRAIRVLVVLGPISAGCLAAILVNRHVPAANNIATAIGRALLIAAVSTAVVWSVDRYARRLLPLAALMQLSLVFPDNAPSRIRSALVSGSSRRLARTLEETRAHGLARDPGDAARQVVSLIGTIGDHDRRTRGHSERVRLFADLIGEELKLSKEDRQKLQWGALLHDLGKLMVPTEILNKKGKPTASEWQVLQGHPDAGMRLIEPLREFLGEWVHAIGGHHEKWNGTGYPRGLAGTDIPRAAAIVAVADSFEVMTSVRSYKKAMPLADARAELTRCAGTHFSPEVVRAMLSISLGHIRLVSGPLSSLAHLPFLGNVVQNTTTLAAAAPSLSSAIAAPIAAFATVASLSVGGPTLTPRPTELASVDVQGSEIAAAGAPGDGASEGAGTTKSAKKSRSGEGGATSSGDTATTESDGSTDPVDAKDSSDPTGTASTTSSPSGDDTTTTTVQESDSKRRSSPETPTTTEPTTAQPAAPTTAAAPAAPATTTATTAAPTTAVPAGAFTISVSTSSLRLPAKNLNNASYARSSKIYVFVAGNYDRVTYTYPGGSRTADDYPFDMMGSQNILQAKSFTLPSTPGTYTITAVARAHGSGQGSGAESTVTATFTVT